MSRKLRTVLTLVLLAGLLGYRLYRDHAAADATPRRAHATAAPAPVPKRMLGRIAFTPCTLAPQFGAGSVEAQCGTLAVAENPALPQGRKIDLHIALVPADEDGSTEPDHRDKACSSESDRSHSYAPHAVRSHVVVGTHVGAAAAAGGPRRVVSR